MDENPSNLLENGGLSNYLKILKLMHYKHVREGKGLCQNIGRHWRFRDEDIDRWLEDTHGDTKGKVDRQ